MLMCKETHTYSRYLQNNLEEEITLQGKCGKNLFFFIFILGRAVPQVHFSFCPKTRTGPLTVGGKGDGSSGSV